MSDYETNELNEEIEVQGETKAEKFSRLATNRMNRLLKEIEGIGKLGNRSSYDYSEDQVEKMFFALQESLDSAKAKFKPAVKSDGVKFSF